MPRTVSKTDKHPTAEEWAIVVRGHGLRATAAVVRVLKLLGQAPAPMTHEEIQDELARDGEGAPDRVTLYRILERLTEVDLCDTFTGTDRRTRFVLHANAPEHMFECSCCHKVVPLAPDPDLPALLERLRKSLKRKGLEAEEARLTLRGKCEDCGPEGPHLHRK